MGQLMGFYAGDADAIGAAYEKHRLRGLVDEQIVRAHADFSLHLTPLDIDFLAEVIAEKTAWKARPFTESLARRVGGDGEERSADVVDPAWVQMVAAADDGTAPDLAAGWIERAAPSMEKHSKSRRRQFKPLVNSSGFVDWP